MHTAQQPSRNARPAKQVSDRLWLAGVGAIVLLGLFGIFGTVAWGWALVFVAPLIVILGNDAARSNP